MDGYLVAGGALKRVGHGDGPGVSGQGVRGAHVELVREPILRSAVPLVAVAATVAEDREAAGVAALDVTRSVGVGAWIVQKDACFVRRPGVIDAVEDEVRPGDVLAVSRQVERFGAKARHRLVSSSADALATA